MLQATQTEEKYLSQEPVFYLGVIEDDKDPTFANRYRVRLIGKNYLQICYRGVNV